MDGIRIMYINSLACVRVRGGESKRFRINSRVRQGCNTSPWLFNVYMDVVIKRVKMVVERRGMRLMEEGREWR